MHKLQMMINSEVSDRGDYHSPRLPNMQAYPAVAENLIQLEGLSKEDYLDDSLVKDSPHIRQKSHSQMKKDQFMMQVRTTLHHEETLRSSRASIT